MGFKNIIDSYFLTSVKTWKSFFFFTFSGLEELKWHEVGRKRAVGSSGGYVVFLQGVT